MMLCCCRRLPSTTAAHRQCHRSFQEFKALYEINDVASYAELKDRIFTRYRTYAEMVGALLVKEARQRRVTLTGLDFMPRLQRL